MSVDANITKICKKKIIEKQFHEKKIRIFELPENLTTCDFADDTIFDMSDAFAPVTPTDENFG